MDGNGADREPMKGEDTRLRLKLWVELDGDNAFGMGSARLLRGVAEHGSLAGSARELGVSYRTAWGRIRRMEARLGRPVLVKRGGNKSGYMLTGFGERCLAAYEAMHDAVLREAQAAFAVQFRGLLDEQDGKRADFLD